MNANNYLLRSWLSVVYCVATTYVALVVLHRIPNWVAGDLASGRWMTLYLAACLVSVIWLLWRGRGEQIFTCMTANQCIFTIVLYIVLAACGEMAFSGCLNAYANSLPSGLSSFKLPFYFVFIPDAGTFGAAALVHLGAVLGYGGRHKVRGGENG